MAKKLIKPHFDLFEDYPTPDRIPIDEDESSFFPQEQQQDDGNVEKDLYRQDDEERHESDFQELKQRLVLQMMTRKGRPITFNEEQELNLLIQGMLDE